MAARAGVEPTTLWLKVIDSTNAPPRPTIRYDLIIMIKGNFRLDIILQCSLVQFSKLLRFIDCVSFYLTTVS